MYIYIYVCVCVYIGIFMFGWLVSGYLLGNLIPPVSIINCNSDKAIQIY